MNCVVSEGGSWGGEGKIPFWLGKWIPFLPFWQKLARSCYSSLRTSLRKFSFSKNSRWRHLVKGPKSTKFDPTNHISARHLGTMHWKCAQGVPDSLAGVLGFFPRHVAKCVILETHDSLNIKCRRLNRCLNTLKMDIVCKVGVLGSLLFLEMVLPS